MADWPIEKLNGNTPMEAAHKPNMDYMAAHGRFGMVKTVAENMHPGSDVANLSVIGYDPLTCKIKDHGTLWTASQGDLFARLALSGLLVALVHFLFYQCRVLLK